MLSPSIRGDVETRVLARAAPAAGRRRAQDPPHDRSRRARPVVHARRAAGLSAGHRRRAACSAPISSSHAPAIAFAVTGVLQVRTDYGHLWVTLGTPRRLLRYAGSPRARPPRRLLRCRPRARLGSAAHRELPRSRALPLCAHRHPRHRGEAGGRQIRRRAAPRRRRALGDQMRVLPAQGRGVVGRRADQPVHVSRGHAVQRHALQDAADCAQPLGRDRALRPAGRAGCLDRPSLHAGDRRRPRPMPS